MDNRVLVKMSSLIKSISMGPFGSDVKVEYMVNEGVPFLDGSNLVSVRMNADSLKFVTREKANSLKNALAHPYDIVVTHRGTIGQLSYIPDDLGYDEFLISQSQFRVSLDTSKVDPVFFAYYFHTKEGQKRLLSFASYVGVPALASATTNFKELEFPLIPLYQQKMIVKILLSYDDKIRNNVNICADLEAMTKLIYDYWFVQFDFPDENGKPYKSSGGKMVWNEDLKREIPDGWEATNIRRIAKILPGGTPSKSQEEYWSNGTIPFFGPTDYQNTVYQFETKEHITEDGLKACSSSLFTVGTVIITARGSVGKLVVVGSPMAMNQSCYAFSPYNKEFVPYVYYLTKQIIESLKVKSTGSVFKSIITDDIDASIVAIGNDKIIEEFCKKTVPMFEKIKLLETENHQLASLRDFLLPMLMNGQVKVGSKDDLPPTAYPSNEIREYMVAAEPSKTYDKAGM